jgi:hypothetical protein
MYDPTYDEDVNVMEMGHCAVCGYRPVNMFEHPQYTTEDEQHGMDHEDHEAIWVS